MFKEKKHVRTHGGINSPHANDKSSIFTTCGKKTLVFHQYLFMESSLSSLSNLGTEESGCRRLKGGCKKIGFCLLRLSVVV